MNNIVFEEACELSEGLFRSIKSVKNNYVFIAGTHEGHSVFFDSIKKYTYDLVQKASLRDFINESKRSDRMFEEMELFTLSKQHKLGIQAIERKLSHLHTCGAFLNYDLMEQGWKLSRAQYELEQMQVSVQAMVANATGCENLGVPVDFISKVVDSPVYDR
jgi:hypothetical protein